MGKERKQRKLCYSLKYWGNSILSCTLTVTYIQNAYECTYTLAHYHCIFRNNAIFYLYTLGYVYTTYILGIRKLQHKRN